MDQLKSSFNVQEIQAPIKESLIQASAKPQATRAEVEGSHSSCVDHLCGCKR